MPAIPELPLTPEGRAAVERFRAARENYDADPAEWRAAYPGFVGAVIEGYRLLSHTEHRAAECPPCAGYHRLA